MNAMVARTLCILVLCAAASSGCVSHGPPAAIPLAEVLQDDPKAVGGAAEPLMAEFHAARIGADDLRGHLSAD